MTLVPSVTVGLIALMVVARKADDHEVAVLGAIAISGIIAFSIVQDNPPSGPKIARLLGDVVAICVATVLLAKNSRERQALHFRSQTVLRRSGLALWELNFSRTLAELDGLKAHGIVDISEHSRTTPGFLARQKKHICFVAMNDAMFAHLGMTPGVDEIPANLASMKIDDDRLLQVLQAIMDGSDHYGAGAREARLDATPNDVFGVSIDLRAARSGCVIGTLIDVREREEANNALIAARTELARATRVAAVGAVSASIAHELNQPIGAILLNAQTCLRYLRRGSPEIGAALSAAERVVRDGNRAAQIVRETRDLVMKRRNRHEALDIAALIREVLEFSRHDIEQAEVELHLQIPTSEAWILGDRVAIQQALMNLISNALHAVAAHFGTRELVIGLMLEHEQVVISVCDSGRGIDDDALERIFDAFYTTKENGTGMGLSISRSAVEAHGGTLKARNRQGGGAIFECRLPLCVGSMEREVQSTSKAGSQLSTDTVAQTSAYSEASIVADRYVLGTGI
ncbi:sensor histidine kinase [Bradyrhizobium sp. NBAIM08]|uniref:sensor histidine kinase n=1 Tax=Bradyrhizobium sp. NBAIM08 TaxID=2793815 RepID=UPI001CD7125D|nr:ATP-binding protein [Bradyrhizobium sp. NBAIM08]MCA1474194.1 hypothetical protein [Bradyrhizobium sp. NBAIM08]